MKKRFPKISKDHILSLLICTRKDTKYIDYAKFSPNNSAIKKSYHFRWKKKEKKRSSTGRKSEIFTPSFRLYINLISALWSVFVQILIQHHFVRAPVHLSHSFLTIAFLRRKCNILLFLAKIITLLSSYIMRNSFITAWDQLMKEITLNTHLT